MKLTKEEVIDILEYNMAMLTCDMSIGRDPEQQDVPPDYYGKDAEDLYYACEYCLNILKNEPSDLFKAPLNELTADTLLWLMMVSKDISPEVIQKTFDLEEPFTKIVFDNKVIFKYNNETKKWELIERGSK